MRDNNAEYFWDTPPLSRFLLGPCHACPPPTCCPIRWQDILRAGPGRATTEEGAYHCPTSCTSPWCASYRPKSPRTAFGERRVRHPSLAVACTTVVRVVLEVATIGWARHAPPTTITTASMYPLRRAWHPAIDGVVFFGRCPRARAAAVGKNVTLKRSKRDGAPHGDGAELSVAGRKKPGKTGMSVAQTRWSEISGQRGKRWK